LKAKIFSSSLKTLWSTATLELYLSVNSEVVGLAPEQKDLRQSLA
jgi:hypothetical protein